MNPNVMKVMRGDFVNDVAPVLQLYISYIKAFNLDPDFYLPHVIADVDTAVADGTSFKKACYDAANTLAKQATALTNEVLNREPGGTEVSFETCVAVALNCIRAYFDGDHAQFTIDVSNFRIIDALYASSSSDIIFAASLSPSSEEAWIINILAEAVFRLSDDQQKNFC